MMNPLTLIIFAGLMLVNLTGCNKGLELKVQDVVKNSAEKENHFVRVVLPNNEKSLGAKATLSLTDRRPLTQVLATDFVLTEDQPPEFYFEVGARVAPATLEINFVSGETKKMRKVVFDTTLTLP